MIVLRLVDKFAEEANVLMDPRSMDCDEKEKRLKQLFHLLN